MYSASSSIKHVALGLHFVCVCALVVLYIGGGMQSQETLMYRLFMAAASFLFLAVAYPPFGLPSPESHDLANRGFKAPKIKST